jgi:hypothetical protein
LQHGDHFSAPPSKADHGNSHWHFSKSPFGVILADDTNVPAIILGDKLGEFIPAEDGATDAIEERSA